MTLTISEVFLAVVLFGCVPLQYFICRNWSSSESSRSYAIKRLVTHITDFREEYLTIDSWKQWVFQLLKMQNVADSYETYFDDGESPAVEVMKFKQNKGFFAMSADPRMHRPPDVQFRVGQVIVHKLWNYRGVIVGWDETAKAPQEWIAEMDGKNKEWKNMPNYAILVDTRDRLTPQLTYVPQENIIIQQSIKIIHPLMDDYFEDFDGAQYIPRPWLQTLYPDD